MAIKQRSKSLSVRGSEFSDTFFQLQVLNGKEMTDAKFPSFSERVGVLQPGAVEIFQINIGKLCNQTCSHCHVDAGPDKKEENMSREDLQRCLEIIASVDSIHTVDITGGAPEMNANFRWFVEEVTALGKKVMDRCNLTIIRANKKYHDLPEFFAKHKVEVVSSLPSFSKNRTDSQRGDGVFEDSIKALQMLNEVGYGKEGSGLVLNLVYNPSGAYLPGDQEAMEAEFKRQLKRKFDIEFNQLFAITNVPISRFLEYLIQTDNYADYMQQLIDAFNPGTVDGLMCLNTLSVSWDGYIHDCDFNQMLDMKVATKNSQHINDFDLATLEKRKIAMNQHCYACTAGSGSSCGGEIS
ncbi:MAG: radical SAM/Cys-rich domain protein [Bacteroidetes bacterium]|nr:radical SAM/Cys-rich domain protein [Bacteroidota bacterium]